MTKLEQTMFLKDLKTLMDKYGIDCGIYCLLSNNELHQFLGVPENKQPSEFMLGLSQAINKMTLDVIGKNQIIKPIC